ncbi:MAG: DUF3604 domain-containing protein [Pseudomonadales bacterium]
MPVMRYMPVAAAMLLALGCSKPDGAAPDAAAAPTVEAAKPPAVEVVPERMALYGDLHVHTQLSFDAYIFGTRSTPETAYAYAKGEPLQHPSGFTMQLKKPLDFEAVTDHDMYMGIVRAMDDPSTKPGQTELGRKIRQRRRRRAGWQPSRRWWRFCAAAAAHRRTLSTRRSSARRGMR